MKTTHTAKTILGFAIIALTLSAASCSTKKNTTSGNNNTNSTQNQNVTGRIKSGNTTVTTREDGTVTATDGTSTATNANVLPPGYPTDAPAIFPGAIIVTSINNNNDFSVLATSTETDVQKIRTFYTNEASTKGWTAIADEAQITTANGSLYTNSFTKNNQSWAVIITLTTDNGGAPQTSIQLTVNTRPIQ